MLFGPLAPVSDPGNIWQPLFCCPLLLSLTTILHSFKSNFPNIAASPTHAVKELKVIDSFPTVILIWLPLSWSHHCSAIVWHSLPLGIIGIGLFLETKGVFQRGEEQVSTLRYHTVIDITGGPGLYHQTLPTNSPSPNVISISSISTPSKSLGSGSLRATTVAAPWSKQSYVHKNTNTLLSITMITSR